VFDILLLLPVSGRLFQGADDKGGCRRDDADGSLSVLDGQLDCDAETFLYAMNVSRSFEAIRFETAVSKRTQSPVALAMSSPTFFGESPRGPILGARVAEDPTSPPVARRWL
jgi:hypothetical protein